VPAVMKGLKVKRELYQSFWTPPIWFHKRAVGVLVAFWLCGWSLWRESVRLRPWIWDGASDPLAS
jgi:hypothetical protein